ncbi:MAG: hypothetical protein ACOYYU_04490 [Chloroflexota bacterium]
MTVQENMKPGQNIPEGDSRSRLLSDLLSRAGLANNQRGLFLLMAFYGAAGLGACSFLDLDPGELPAGGEPTNTPPPTATNKPAATPTQAATETPTVAPTEIPRSFVTINPPVEPYYKDNTPLVDALNQATDPIQRVLLQSLIDRSGKISRHATIEAKPCIEVPLFDEVGMKLGEDQRALMIAQWNEFLSTPGDARREIAKSVNLGPLPPGTALRLYDDDALKERQDARYNPWEAIEGKQVVIDRAMKDALTAMQASMIIVDLSNLHWYVINPPEIMLSNPPKNFSTVAIGDSQFPITVSEYSPSNRVQKRYGGSLIVRIYSWSSFGDQTLYNSKYYFGYHRAMASKIDTLYGYWEEYGFSDSEFTVFV